MIITLFWFVVALITTFILGLFIGFKFRDGVVDITSVGTPALEHYVKKLKDKKQFKKAEQIEKILTIREQGGNTWFERYMMKDKAE